MEVFKTYVTCEIGFSIADQNNNWSKSKVAISSEVGPGYPDKDFLAWVVQSQIADATNACNEQIEELAKRISETAHSNGTT